MRLVDWKRDRTGKRLGQLLRARVMPVRVTEDLEVSPVVFGAGRLHHLSARQSDRLLEAVAECGVGHIDTAPSYGHGLGEERLREFLHRHPGVSVTTKVGLYSPVRAFGGWPGLLALKAAGKLAPGLTKSKASGSIRRARESLERSLRKLGRDRIDALMIHEPDVGLMHTDEWRRWLEGERESGRVRAYGLAGRADRLLEFSAGEPWIGQTDASLPGALADMEQRGLRVAFAYGLMRGAGDGAEAAARLGNWRQSHPSTALILGTLNARRLREAIACFND